MANLVVGKYYVKVSDGQPRVVIGENVSSIDYKEPLVIHLFKDADIVYNVQGHPDGVLVQEVLEYFNKENLEDVQLISQSGTKLNMTLRSVLSSLDCFVNSTTNRNYSDMVISVPISISVYADEEKQIDVLTIKLASGLRPECRIAIDRKTGKVISINSLRETSVLLSLRHILKMADKEDVKVFSTLDKTLGEILGDALDYSNENLQLRTRKGILVAD